MDVGLDYETTKQVEESMGPFKYGDGSFLLHECILTMGEKQMCFLISSTI